MSHGVRSMNASLIRMHHVCMISLGKKSGHEGIDHLGSSGPLGKQHLSLTLMVGDCGKIWGLLGHSILRAEIGPLGNKWGRGVYHAVLGQAVARGRAGGNVGLMSPMLFDAGLASLGSWWIGIPRDAVESVVKRREGCASIPRLQLACGATESDQPSC
ncbi:hypothetical protein NE237_025956 [Protea cynaroides]|uniref:Uncharacterized protein n=1 Tax=Protea cynaroides TaxID=273540 RepID=A0A9Q0H406_9MAGN|nr:hypothetical protein NE237_025956 [Protea cynaroides]